MADALLGKTEIDAVSMELVLGAMVQKQLIQEAVLMDKVSMYSAPLGVDKLKIPRAGNFTVNDKSENTAVDAQILTYATDDLALDKHKVIQVLVEKLALKQSAVAIYMDIASRAAKGIALQFDTDVIAALVATSASSPDHRIAFAGASIAAVDILEAKRLLKVQNLNFGECYLGINPTEEKAMLQISDFVRADGYGSGQAIQSGVLGSIYGAKVVVHNGFTAGNAVTWHPTHVAAAIQAQVEFEQDKDLANLSERLSWDTIYGVKTLDSGKRGVLLGSAS
jgi:hypothetical protein